MEVRIQGDVEGGTNWEIRIDIYVLLRVKQIAKWEPAVLTGSSARCSAMTLRGGIRGREGQEGEDIHTHTHS